MHQALTTYRTPKISENSQFLSQPNLQDNSEEISWLNKTERTQKPFKKQHSYLVNVPACKHAANICSAVIWVSCRLLETSCSIQSNSEGTSVTAAATDLPTSLVVNFGNELCNKAQHVTVIWHCANQYCTTANWHDLTASLHVVWPTMANIRFLLCNQAFYCQQNKDWKFTAKSTIIALLHKEKIVAKWTRDKTQDCVTKVRVYCLG